MNCEDARFAVAASPASTEAGLLEHLHTCAACAAYADEMRQLDERLRTAMRVDVPPLDWPAGLDEHPVDAVPAGTTSTGSDTVVPLRTSERSTRRAGFAARFAMAASVAAMAVIVGLFWAGYPRESLASAVVGHLAEEPQSWTSSTPVPAAEVAQKLRRAGVRLDAGLPTVTYLQMCQFRGHYVPHFVVQSATGPVTIMVLADEAVARRTEFAENGYRGVLVPADRGSIAVLARGPQDLDVAASQALSSIHYVD